MAIARHGSGPGAAARAVASQVHPVFMLPPVALSLIGGLVSPAFDPFPAAGFSVAVFAGLYTAHVKDGYVDFHVRGEDDDHPLTERGCWVAAAGSTAGFVAAVLGLVWLVDVRVLLFTVPGWLIAFAHAPTLDTNPVTATVGYPLGNALALLGGYFVQATTLSRSVLGLAAVVLVTLSGIKVVDDETDVEYDRSIAKRTVAVVLGPARARRVAHALLAGGVALVAAFVAAGVFPPGTLVPAAAFGIVAVVAGRRPARVATMLLIRGSYVFLALLLGVLWYRPTT